MNRLCAACLALIGLFLAGCSTPAVAFKDMSPAPRAAISGNWLTVYLGADSRDSLKWVHTNVKIEGSKVCIAGYRTAHLASKELSLPLPDATAGLGLEILWMNPDGSSTPIPLQTEKPVATVASQ